jgi:hypothetical protein
VPGRHRGVGPIRRLLGLILGCAVVGVGALVAAVLLIGTGGGDASSGRTDATTVAIARSSPPPAAPTSHLRWIVAGDDLAELRADNAGVARRFFDNPETFVIGSRQTQDQVPHGYRSIPILSYASLRSFVSDVHSGAIEAEIAAVLYDPEHWSRTPDAERRDPVAAMRRFTSFARSWGYGALLSPGRDLALDSDSACHKGPHELLDRAFLRCGLIAPASGAEAFVVQTAPEELQPGRIAGLLEATRERLAAAGEEVELFATLSTSPPGEGAEVWPGDLVEAAERAIAAGAAGLVLNVGPGDVDLAASFLRDLERAGPVAGVAVSRAD